MEANSTNSALACLPGSNDGTINSTMVEQDAIRKIQQIYSVMKLIQSRKIFIEAILEEENNDIEEDSDHKIISEQYKSTLNKLWTTVEDGQLKTAALKTVIYSSLGPRLSRKLSPLAAQLVPVIEKEEIIYQSLEDEHGKFVNLQTISVDCTAEVKRKIHVGEAQSLDERKRIIMRRRLLNAEVARAIINYTLNGGIDFELHPELLELKIKYRRPLSERI